MLADVDWLNACNVSYRPQDGVLVPCELLDEGLSALFPAIHDECQPQRKPPDDLHACIQLELSMQRHRQSVHVQHARSCTGCCGLNRRCSVSHQIANASSMLHHTSKDVTAQLLVERICSIWVRAESTFSCWVSCA